MAVITEALQVALIVGATQVQGGIVIPLGHWPYATSCAAFNAQRIASKEACITFLQAPASDALSDERLSSVYLQQGDTRLKHPNLTH